VASAASSTKAANTAWPLPGSFSPYSPSLLKCSAARSQWRRALHVRHEDIGDHQIERAIAQRGKAALGAVRDRDPESALLEPYAHGKAGMQVVIDHQDAPHDPPPSPRRTLNAPVSHPGPKGTTFHTTARAVLPCESVHYRISVANQRSVCPLQCIRPVPQPRAAGPEIYFRPQHATGFENARRCSTTDRRCPMRPSSRRHGLLRRRGFEPAAEWSGAFRNHLARHEQPRLMKCPAICCVQMRSHPVGPRLPRLLLPARDLRDGKALPPIREFLARMIGARTPRSRSRRMRLSGRGLASYSGGHAAARGRYLAGRSPLFNAAL
jgi:hypothetical protein